MQVKNVTRAMQMMAVFMHEIWNRAYAASKMAPLHPVSRHTRSGAHLPKGFRGHNPAGTKIARLAAAQAIGKRGRVQA